MNPGHPARITRLTIAAKLTCIFNRAFIVAKQERITHNVDPPRRGNAKGLTYPEREVSPTVGLTPTNAFLSAGFITTTHQYPPLYHFNH